ncbi:MAG: hypothetical protein WA268_27765 [Xanthobacteraceae bacterium]
MSAGIAAAADDARMRQLRLLCAQLSGDLTDPGGIAAFRRCLTSHDPLNEIRRDNNIAAPADRPDAAPPRGFGRDSRRRVAANIEGFETGEANVIYVLDGAGRLWRGAVEGNNARLIDEKVGGFRFVDGHLFIRGSDGGLWRLKPDGTERTRVDQGVVAFQPLTAGLIYVLGADRTLWRETVAPSKRAIVDRTVKDFQAIDASIVTVLGTDGKLWRETGTMQTRTLIAGSIAAFQDVANGTTYVLTTDSILWRQTGNGNAEQVDQSVAAFQAIDSRTAFVLGNDGRLWRDDGGRSGAVLVDRDLLVVAGKVAFHADDPRRVYIVATDHTLWLEALP